MNKIAKKLRAQYYLMFRRWYNSTFTDIINRYHIDRATGEKIVYQAPKPTLEQQLWKARYYRRLADAGRTDAPHRMKYTDRKAEKKSFPVYIENSLWDIDIY